MRSIQSAPPELTLDVGALDDRPETWSTSQERSWYVSRRAVAYLAAAIGAVFGIGAASLAIEVDGSAKQWALIPGAISAATLVWATLPYASARRAFVTRRKAMIAFRLEQALESACAEDLPLRGLFKLNRKQLDAYQDLTKRQQKQAFVMTWLSAFAGFGVLVAGLVLVINVDSKNQQYIAGGLAAVSSALSAYLGKTFYAGHRAAMEQLNRYYREPFVTGRVLAAERIVQEPKDELFAKDFVTALLDWDCPEPDDPGALGADQAAESGSTKSATTSKTKTTSRTSSKAAKKIPTKAPAPATTAPGTGS